jgi:hypothetical protein
LSGLVMRQMQEMECSKYIGSVDKQNRRCKKLGVEWKHRPCSFGFWSTSKSSVRVNQSKGVTDHGSLRFSLQRWSKAAALWNSQQMADYYSCVCFGYQSSSELETRSKASSSTLWVAAILLWVFITLHHHSHT